MEGLFKGVLIRRDTHTFYWHVLKIEFSYISTYFTQFLNFVKNYFKKKEGAMIRMDNTYIQKFGDCCPMYLFSPVPPVPILLLSCTAAWQPGIIQA